MTAPVTAPVTAQPVAAARYRGPVPVRRTHAERSAAMRARLLDATIECLVEHGYTGTTVARVAEQARVTRGAQVHHFASKELLVIAAVRRLNELRQDEIRELLATTATDEDFVERVLDLLWQLHQGPVFAATAEIWIAGRTTPVLAEHLAEVEEVVSVENSASRLSSPEMRDAVFTAMDAMRGLALSTWHLDATDVEARWRRLKRHLRVVFAAAAA